MSTEEAFKKAALENNIEKLQEILAKQRWGRVYLDDYTQGKIFEQATPEVIKFMIDNKLCDKSYGMLLVYVIDRNFVDLFDLMISKNFFMDYYHFHSASEQNNTYIIEKLLNTKCCIDGTTIRNIGEHDNRYIMQLAIAKYNNESYSSTLLGELINTACIKNNTSLLLWLIEQHIDIPYDCPIRTIDSKSEEAMEILLKHHVTFYEFKYEITQASNECATIIFTPSRIYSHHPPSYVLMVDVCSPNYETDLPIIATLSMEQLKHANCIMDSHVFDLTNANIVLFSIQEVKE